MKITTVFIVAVVDSPSTLHSWTIGIVPANGCISLPPTTPNR